MRTSAERWVRVGVLAGLVLVGSGRAHAVDRDTSERLTLVTDKLLQLDTDVSDVRRNNAERGVLMGSVDADRRYRDAMYFYMLGEYANAAQAFYVLHRARALRDEAANKDVEWYLAESLYGMGDVRGSESWYAAIAGRGVREPYYADAVRRLFDVYGRLGNADSFDATYEAHVVSGRVKADDAVNYTLAKGFWRRGDHVRAKSIFEAIPAGSPVWARARYFLGAMMVQEKNLVAAITEFKKVDALQVAEDATDDQRVKEYARLALARLYYESGDFEQASTWYATITDRSPHFVEKSYESVWAFVKQERWDEALAQIDTFLLAFPENRFSADMRLLRGKIHLKTGQYDSARVSFEEASALYAPTVEQLSAARGTQAELETLLEGVAGTLSVRLPAYAMETLRSRDEVVRASALHRNLNAQEAELAASEAILQEVAPVLQASGPVLGAFATSREELDRTASVAMSLRGEIIEIEATYIRGMVAASYRSELDAIRRERTSLVGQLARDGDETRDGVGTREQAYDAQVRQVQLIAARLTQVVHAQQDEARAIADQLVRTNLPAADAQIVRDGLAAQQAALDALARELLAVQGDGLRRRIVTLAGASEVRGASDVRSELLPRFEALRARVLKWRHHAVDPDSPAIFAQLDTAWGDVARIEAAAVEARRMLDSREMTETRLVRDVFSRVVADVKALRTTFDAGAPAARRTAYRAAALGIEALEQSFRTQVAEAEGGVLDVYWERSSAAADRSASLKSDRSAFSEALLRRYGLVEDTLGKDGGRP
ncbi:MAG: hypothetical protein RLZZ299_1158 [Pseudomonadota bacterium]